jgi:hypothetical protein
LLRCWCHIAIYRGLAIDVAPANRHDTKAIVPVLRELANGGFQGPALSDLGWSIFTSAAKAGIDTSATAAAAAFIHLRMMHTPWALA